ncbi:MAG: hypothetical protein LKE47_12475 [Prevotella sp.]|nr:hypothetical protein [Prevotella sp.]MCH3971145.1 hypothetical protein [Prevotella sp.]
MNTKMLLLVSGVIFSLQISAKDRMPAYLQYPERPISEVPFTNVHLSDGFWSPRIEINRTVTIPYAFHECEVNGRFDNFAIAAGLKKGKQRGDFPFDDTDPYKVIEGSELLIGSAL